MDTGLYLHTVLPTIKIVYYSVRLRLNHKAEEDTWFEMIELSDVFEPLNLYILT